MSYMYDDDNILQGTALSWTGTLDRRIQLGTQVILLQMLIVFVQIAICICQNLKYHLPKLQTVFVKFAKLICPRPDWNLRKRVGESSWVTLSHS